jgi:ribosomal-protein-alanine N-acetyltransferase
MVRAMVTCRFIEDEQRPGLAPQVAALEAVLEPHPWGEDSLRNTLLRPETLLAVSEAPDGQLRSYCLMQRVLDEATILQVGTDPAFQRQGLARQLIQACCDRLRTLEVATLWLEVRAHNTPALALYEQLGFVKTGVRPRYYPPIVPGESEEDALVLSLSIPPA